MEKSAQGEMFAIRSLEHLDAKSFRPLFSKEMNEDRSPNKTKLSLFWKKSHPANIYFYFFSLYYNTKWHSYLLKFSFYYLL